MTRIHDDDAQAVETIDHIWRSLRKIERALTPDDEQAIQESGINLTEYAALTGLSSPEGRSSADMARCLSISAQATHNIVVRLEERDLVERVADAYSNVIRINRLTPKGRAALAKANQDLDNLERHRKSVFGEASYRDIMHACGPAVVYGDNPTAADDESRELLASHLGSAIRNIRRQAGHAASAQLKEQRLTVTLSQAIVLDCLQCDGPLPVQKVSTATGLPQQTVSYCTAKLLEHGFIAGHVPPRHRNINIYAVTVQGERQVNDHRASVIAATEPILNRMAATTEELSRILADIETTLSR